MKFCCLLPLIIYCCLLTVFSTTARAADFWKLTKVQMVSQTNGWALAETPRGSVLLKTSSSGRDWHNISPKNIWPLSAQQVQHNQDVGQEGIDTDFLDAQTGWIAMENWSMENWSAGNHQPSQGTQGQVIVERTRDGGHHWTENRFPENIGFFIHLSFLDRRHGFILAISDMASGSTKKALYRTNDGGRTWLSVTEILPDHIDPTGVTFRNASQGWLTAGYHGSDEVPFYRTDDAGRHWHLQRLDLSALYQKGYCIIYPPAFFGAGLREGVLPIKVVTHKPEQAGDALYQTQNAGHTWQFLHRLPPKLKNWAETSVQFINFQTGWTLENAGTDTATLLLTQDGGRQWRTVSPRRRKSH